MSFERRFRHFSGYPATLAAVSQKKPSFLREMRRSRIWLRTKYITLALVASLVGGKPCAAQIVDVPKIVGVDHTVDQAFDRLNESIDRAQGVANAINQDAKDRLDQIDKIKEETLDRLQAIETKSVGDLNKLYKDALNDATDRIGKLEKKFTEDLQALIDSTVCGASLILNQSAIEALGSFGKLIGTNQVEIKAPLLYDGETQWFFCKDDGCKLTKTIDIQTEFFSNTYHDIRSYLLRRLEFAREDTPRYAIVSTYTVIAELAKRTVCFTKGAATDYVDDYAFYINKAKVWDIVPPLRK